MDKKDLQKLKLRNVNLLPLDEKVAKRIGRLSDATGASAEAIIDAATQVLEVSLGRNITVHDEPSQTEVKIDTYKKYPEISKLEFNEDEEE
jgi:hypothetical protein